jgi:hypothetical protein
VNQPPDAARDKAAKDHSQAMISGTRRFWTLVAAETDNDREGIPKGGQTSALGITLPPRHWRKLAWRLGRRRGASANAPPSPLLARGGGPGPEPRPHVRRARANVDHRLAPGLGRRALSRKGPDDRQRQLPPVRGDDGRQCRPHAGLAQLGPPCPWGGGRHLPAPLSHLPRYPRRRPPEPLARLSRARDETEGLRPHGRSIGKPPPATRRARGLLPHTADHLFTLGKRPQTTH